MANAVAAQLLMPLVAGADLLNVYRVFAAVLPELRARVDGFAAPAGQIFDQLQLAVPGRRTVLTLADHPASPGSQTFLHTIRFDASGERIVMALFKTHGFSVERWPDAVRRQLWP